MNLKDLHSSVLDNIYNDTINLNIIDGKPYRLDGEYIGDRYSTEIKPILTIDRIAALENLHALREFQSENDGFVFVFFEMATSLLEMTKVITKQDIARLMYLSTFTSYDDGRIVKNNGKEFSKQELAEMLKFSSKSYKIFIDKLSDANFLILDGDKIFVNHSIFKYGEINHKRLMSNNISFTRMFKKSIRDIFENSKPTELNRLANIYLLLPYINFNTNVVCYNPEESNPNKVKPILYTDLPEVLGFKDYRKMSKALNKITVGDEYVFALVQNADDARSKIVIINPRVVYSNSNSEYLEGVLSIFSALPKPKKND